MPARGYVCFRKQLDEFFVVYFDSQPETLGRIRKQTESDSSPKKYPASGYFTTYKDGVNDQAVMPSLFFSGKWLYVIDDWRFASDMVNFVEETRPGKIATVAINADQIVVSDYKYKNVLNKDVAYNLTIQRSTGRFSESMVREGEQLPFIEGTGRCIYVTAKTAF